VKCSQERGVRTVYPRRPDGKTQWTCGCGSRGLATDEEMAGVVVAHMFHGGFRATDRRAGVEAMERAVDKAVDMDR